MILLLLIVFLASLLRIYSLAAIPNGFFFDEATISYQAYSILQTGKDTWGNFLPLLSFKDYGEHILPIGIYGQSVFISLGGLNVFWARFPHAILGVLQIVLIYFLGKELFTKRVGLLSAFLLAVQPLSLGWSRFVFEGNFGTVFFLGGLLFFIKFIKTRKSLPLALLLFGLSMLSYHIFLVTTPIFVFLLLVTFFPGIKSGINKRTLLFSLGVVAFFLVWSAGAIYSGAGRQRFSQASTLVAQPKIDLLNNQIGLCAASLPLQICKIFLNKPVLALNSYAQNYFGHFSPTFLAFDGTFLRQNLLPKSGILLPVEMLGFFLGLVALVRSKNSFKHVLLPIVLVYPLANSFTGVGEISRIAFAAPYFSLISAYGLSVAIKRFKALSYLIPPIFLFCVASFLLNYFVFFPKTNAYYTNFGYDKVFSWINRNQSNYDRIYISRNYSGSVPYISALFFLPVKPGDFQEGKIDRYKDEKNYFITARIGKYIFFQDINKINPGENDFLIITPEELAFRTYSPEFTIIDPTGRVLLIGLNSHEFLEKNTDN